MAKVKAVVPDATLTETGPGMYLARFFNPDLVNVETGEKGAWDEIRYIDGFAQAKMGMVHRRKMGKAIFKNLIVVRATKGKY